MVITSKNRTLKTNPKQRTITSSERRNEPNTSVVTMPRISASPPLPVLLFTNRPTPYPLPNAAAPIPNTPIIKK